MSKRRRPRCPADIPTCPCELPNITPVVIEYVPGYQLLEQISLFFPGSYVNDPHTRHCKPYVAPVEEVFYIPSYGGRYITEGNTGYYINDEE